MAIKITRWKPDTCSCILEYEWDDATTEDTRVHTPITAVEKCVYHQLISDIQSHFTTISEECGRKNKFFNKLHTDFSNFFTVVTNPDGTTSVQLKDGRTITWYYDLNRILHFVCSGSFTNPERNAIRNYINSNNIVGIIVD